MLLRDCAHLYFIYLLTPHTDLEKIVRSWEKILSNPIGLGETKVLLIKELS